MNNSPQETGWKSVPGDTGWKPAPLPAGNAPAPGMTRNVLSNWLWYVLVMLSGFVVPRLIDRHQGQELLGVWDLGWSLVVYVSLLAMGVGSAVNRYTARHRALGQWDALNATINSSLMLLMLSCGVGVAAAVLFASYVPWLLPGAAPETVAAARMVVLLLTIGAALQLPAGVFNGVITGYQRFDVLNLVRGSIDALLLITMVILLLAGYGLVMLAWANLIGQLATGVVKMLVARRLCPELRISPRLCRWHVTGDVLSFGGRTLLQGAASGGLYQANSILVAAFMGPAALAVYARQRSLVVHTMRFIKQYAQVFVPTSSSLDARADRAGLQRLLITSSRYGLYATLPIVLVLLIMGGPLLRVWMGPAYEAPAVLALLAAGHLLSVSQLGVYSVLMGMGRHGRPALYDLAGAACGVALAAVMLGPMQAGMLGAALGLALPVAVTGGVLMPVYACRLLDLDVRRYVAAVAPGPVFSSLPLAGCLLLGRWLFADSARGALAVGLVTGGGVLAAIYWRWVLPASLKVRVRRLMRLPGWAEDPAGGKLAVQPKP